MSDYKNTRDSLSDALNLMTPDGPEWVKTRAAIAALDDAEVAQAKGDFINASRRLDDAVAKLSAIVTGLGPEAAPAVWSAVTDALDALAPAGERLQALLSGEPASALPGMSEGKQPHFPTPAAPIVAPVRELARADASQDAAAADVARMIDDILRREGGFVDHPNDRGGPTKFGITQRTLAASRGRAVARQEVADLDVDEAREIYRSRYFSGPQLDRLPASLQPLLFDMSINHGPGTAIRLLQEVLNQAGHRCEIDGGIGDETLACARAASDALGDALVNRLADRRVAFYKAIVAGDASQGVFLRGWLARAEEFRRA